MRPEQFHEVLNVVPVRWELRENGAIRGRYGGESGLVCPITAVCLRRLQVKFALYEPVSAATALGLDARYACGVILASDTWLHHLISAAWRSERDALLHFTGLTEPEEVKA